MKLLVLPSLFQMVADNVTLQHKLNPVRSFCILNQLLLESNLTSPESAKYAADKMTTFLMMLLFGLNEKQIADGEGNLNVARNAIFPKGYFQFHPKNVLQVSKQMKIGSIEAIALHCVQIGRAHV